MATHLNATLAQWLVHEGTRYSERYNSEVTVFRFDIPKDDWTRNMLPVQDSETPKELGGAGTILGRDVEYDLIPGYTVVFLTTGWGPWHWFDGTGIVTTRPVFIQRRLLSSLDTPAYQMAGLVPITNKAATRKYMVEGDDDQLEQAYQMIRIKTLMSPTNKDSYMGTVGGRDGQLNSVQWVLGGLTCEINTLMFRGMTNDYVRNTLVNGVRMHTVLFDFMKAPEDLAWPLVANRYEWERQAIQTSYKDTAGNTIGEKPTVSWSRVDATVTSVKIRTEFDFAGALGGLV